MSIQGLVDAIKDAAPLVAGIIGSASPITGLLLDGLGHLFGVSTASPAAIATAVAADPDAKIKLKEFELKHSEILEQYSLQTYQTEVDDRKNARDRDVAETKLLGGRDWVMDSIAIIVVVGFFGMALVVALTKLDQSDHDVLYTLIGQMAAGFICVLSFFFGSMRKP